MKNRRTNSTVSLMGLIGIAIFVLVLLGLMIKYAFVAGAELYLGMYTVLGIGILLIMMTIMAIVFSQLNLADSKQALGLPEGSIRALIALILLLVFIILSIYVFRVVGFSNPAISADGAQMAQQLTTTLATLAVAVSGFYFGSTTVAAARDITAPSSPIIRNLEPKEGKVGEEISLKITGKNFRLPKTVRLVRGSTEIAGTSILSNDTEIQCKINIPADAQTDTKWDLIIGNQDGVEDTLVEAFWVNPPSS